MTPTPDHAASDHRIDGLDTRAALCGEQAGIDGTARDRHLPTRLQTSLY